MREILFRGKRADNGEWVEGYYAVYPDGKEKIARKCDSPPDGDPMWKKVLIEYEANPSTICQYTGLTDKDGRKIFEGDIVRLPKCENDIAVFTLRGCNYFLKGNHFDYELGSCDSKCFEIIGNIFDNPELWEVS